MAGFHGTGDDTPPQARFWENILARKSGIPAAGFAQQAVMRS